MTPSLVLKPIGKFTAIFLLITSCHNAPSRVVGVPSDTSHPAPKSTVAPAPQNADSMLPRKGPATFRDFVTDLNGDGIPDTIILGLSLRDTNYFTTVAIAIRGFGRQSFRVADTAMPWTDFDDWFKDSSANALDTRRFFVRKNAKNTVLLLFGFIGEGTSREGFTVIKIEHNLARQVLDQVSQHLDIENIYFLRDLDGDGRFELMCGNTFQFDGSPDTLGGLVGPYSPTFVYTIDDTCFLNKRLMRQYNEENYLFAGYEFSNEIKVFYPDDRSKKPRLWKP